MIEPCEEVKRVEQSYEKALDNMEKHYKDVLKQIRAEIAELDMRFDTKAKILEIMDKYTDGVEP